MWEFMPDELSLVVFADGVVSDDFGSFVVVGAGSAVEVGCDPFVVFILAVLEAEGLDVR